MKEENIRAHVMIKGIVQGVFFRVETKKAADAMGVCGWVRNRSNGDVEATFEGTKGLVKEMIQWCHKGSPRSSVEDVTVQWEDYNGEFKDFGIRY